jgi:tetratricopeptide (TPR) repeat protein
MPRSLGPGSAFVVVTSFVALVGAAAPAVARDVMTAPSSPPSLPAPVTHRFPQARDAFEQGRQADPAFGGGDVRRAVEGYRRAIGFDVDNAQYRNYLGAALLSAGDAGGAVRAFGEAVRLSPREVKYVVNLGYAWHRAGNELRALVWYQRAVALDANDVRAHLFAGYALQNLALSAEAVTEFEAVLHVDPGNTAASQALRRLGVAPAPATSSEPLGAPLPLDAPSPAR